MAQQQGVITQNIAKPVYYTDIDTNLSLNPITGALAILTNENAVMVACRNLILTALSERPYENQIGSKTATLLFEPDDPPSLQILQTTIEDVLRNFEPRVTLVGVQIIDDQTDASSIIVNIVISINNLQVTIPVTIALARTR